MKKIAAALFMIVMLLASVSLSEETVPVNASEGSRLIGLLITREDLAGYTDESGVLLASCEQKGPDDEIEYHFGDVNGLRLICFIVSEDNGDGSIISNADDGISAVDFNMSEDGCSIEMNAAINFVPDQDEALFFYNPVLRTDSGQVFAVPGDFMAVSAAMNPPGSSVGQTVRDERKHTENGSETTDTTTVSIQIKSVREPIKFRLLQFNTGHELLGSEEYEPGTLPEQIVPLAEADYLLLETVEKDPEGGSFTRREAIGRDVDYLNTMSCREDGICLCHYHEVLWETIDPKGASVKETIAGNMKTYQEMADGTWMCDGYTYQSRLEIKGRMPNASVDSCFVYLSNIGELSFEQAYKAAGLSSNQDDYFSPEDAVLVDESVSVDKDTFTVPNIISAKGIEDFIGEWHYFRIVNEDGSEMNREEMLAEGLAYDDRAEVIITKDDIILYAASLDDSASVKYEFVPDDGSLRILNGSDEFPVMHRADNGMLIIFIPGYNLSSGSTTAYLTRRVP